MTDRPRRAQKKSFADDYIDPDTALDQAEREDEADYEHRVNKARVKATRRAAGGELNGRVTKGPGPGRRGAPGRSPNKGPKAPEDPLLAKYKGMPDEDLSALLKEEGIRPPPGADRLHLINLLEKSATGWRPNEAEDDDEDYNGSD